MSEIDDLKFKWIYIGCMFINLIKEPNKLQKHIKFNSSSYNTAETNRNSETALATTAPVFSKNKLHFFHADTSDLM